MTKWQAQQQQQLAERAGTLLGNPAPFCLRRELCVCCHSGPGAGAAGGQGKRAQNRSVCSPPTVQRPSQAEWGDQSSAALLSPSESLKLADNVSRSSGTVNLGRINTLRCITLQFQ